MTFDKMNWHYGSETFPKNLASENGGTHIGMYLTWIIEHNMVSEMHQEDAQEEILMVLSHKWTGLEFLIQVCDEAFSKEDLTEEGNRFTAYYYGKNGYYNDYVKIVGDHTAKMYEFNNSWENYQEVKNVISQRYAEWQKNDSAAQSIANQAQVNYISRIVAKVRALFYDPRRPR